MEFNNTITIKTNSNASAQNALRAARTALIINAETFNEGYAFKPSEDLSDALEVNGNNIEVDDGFFMPEDILEVIKSVTAAIANELKDESFTGNVYTSSTYSENEIEISFANRKLDIRDTFFRNGYVECLCCEECGEDVVRLEDFDPNAVYRCPKCGEEIDLHEQYKEYAPVITETVVNI